MKCAFIIIYCFQDYFSCGNKAFGEEDIWSSSLDWKMMFSYEHTIPENDDPVTSVFFFPFETKQQNEMIQPKYSN
jgi:hypothetical protein